jgi:ubiquinone/menaquinone biosynthesis C-methylase UbiE
MAGMLYDNKAAAQLEQAYATTDMIVQREELRRSLRASAGESILDLGSGPGFLACELAQEVGATGRIAAVDISPDMNSIASKRIAAAGLSDRVEICRATRPRLRLQTPPSTPLSRRRSLSTSPSRTPRSIN